jgi:hypothetical protein
MDSKQGEKSPSYYKVTTKDTNGTSSMRPSFDLSLHLIYQIFQDNINKKKGMEIEDESSHTKVARTWEPGKCISQDSMAPRYVISSI